MDERHRDAEHFDLWSRVVLVGGVLVGSLGGVLSAYLKEPAQKRAGAAVAVLGAIFAVAPQILGDKLPIHLSTLRPTPLCTPISGSHLDPRP
jgi:hypothetical protein